MNIIDDLYLGNINPNENMTIRDKEYRRIAKLSVEQADNLMEKMNADEKKLFEDFIDSNCTMNALEIRLRFIEGFRLGAQIILDVLTRPEPDLSGYSDQ